MEAAVEEQAIGTVVVVLDTLVEAADRFVGGHTIVRVGTAAAAVGAAGGIALAMAAKASESDSQVVAAVEEVVDTESGLKIQVEAPDDSVGTVFRCRRMRMPGPGWGILGAEMVHVA